MNKPYETIELDGYTANIDLDTIPSNPFEEWDCEPPLLVFHESLKSYDAPSIGDLVALIPESHFARHNRVELIREFLPDLSLREFADGRVNYGDKVRDWFAEELEREYAEPCRHSGWSYASEYFDLLESLCKLAGVPCYNGQSNGYSQGHSALVLAFATPAWAEKVGAPPETHERQCKDAFDLYSAWAWGDVFGVSSIEDPEGEDIEGGSCWGFYGRDHKQSGLLEHARSTIAWHKEETEREERETREWEERETIERSYWESRDLVTA
jgi:hypothetical protein